MALLNSLTDVVDSLMDATQSCVYVMDSWTDALESFTAFNLQPTPLRRSHAEDERTYIGAGVWSSVQLELGTRAVKRFGWSYKAVRMYRPYRVLEAERISAKYNIKERQTLSFLDLPGEIRTQIYKLALVFEGIETDTRSSHRSHTYACAGPASYLQHEPSPNYKNWRNTVKPALGLLRLNKQINAEAAGIFYGHNEFRFTSANGRDVLEAFCKTIGEANTRRLAKITHHVTFDNQVDHCSCLENLKTKRVYQISQACYQRLPLWLCKSNTGKRRIPQERWKDLPVWLKWTGMHMQGTIQSQDLADFDFARALTDGKGGLREYKLVLPHDLHIKREHVERHLRCIFDHVANPRDGTSGIKITLVLLDPHFRALDRLVSMSSLALIQEYQLRCDFVRLALQWGWEVVMANAVDKVTGNYVYSAPLGSLEEFIGKINEEISRAPHKDV